MTLESETSWILKAGTIVGIAIMTAGLLLKSFDVSNDILAIGTLILIFTPVAGIAVSLKCFAQMGDRRWLGIGMVLVCVLLAGIAISFFD